MMKRSPHRDHLFCRRTFRPLPLLLILGMAALRAETHAPAGPPETRVDNVRETLYGAEITDPYRWLEDRNDPGTRAWIEAQNEYSHSLLRSLPGREKLRRRFTKLLKRDSVRMPLARNGLYFYMKRRGDQELPVIVMREGPGGREKTLIDPHPMSEDNTVSVEILDVSRDGSLLAYGVRQGGEDEQAVRLFDVKLRKDLPDRLPKARYFGVSLMPDRSGLYYSRHGREGSRVRYHPLGSDPSRDALIFGEGYGPMKSISPAISGIRRGRIGASWSRQATPSSGGSRSPAAGSSSVTSATSSPT